MKRTLKYLLAGLAGVVAVALIALAVVMANFDAAGLKARIAQAAKDHTQRTLTIDGALKLSVFPRIGVDLGKLTLSEHGSSRTFATIDAAHASVDVLPLLSGQIVVDRIAIDGLKATLTRRKDGSSNFDDLLGGGKPKGDAAPASAPARHLDIAGIDISHTAVEWHDEAKNQRLAIKGLQLKTGRLGGSAPSKFEIAMHVTGAAPKFDLKVGASGSLRLDPAAKHYRVDRLAATLSGTASGLSIEKLDIQGSVGVGAEATDIEAFTLRLAAKQGADTLAAALDIPKAHFAKDSVRAEKIQGKAQIAQAGKTLNATLSIPGMEGAGRTFKAGDLRLELDGKLGDSAIKGHLTGPVSGNVETQRYELAKLSGQISLSGAGLPKGAAAISLEGGAAIDAARKTAQFSAAARFDESNINARVNLLQFSPATVAFDLAVDRLNLDTYFPPKADAAAKPGADTPLDLSALKAFNASGAIKIGALQVSRIKAANINAQVKLANGRLEVSPHSAQLYQGSAAGALVADANGNRIALKETLSGVAIGPLLQDVASKDILEGRGNLALDVSAAGASVGALKKALNGTARIDLRDGAVKGINLAETLRKAKAALGAKGASEQGANKQEKTDFSELTASFTIRDGIAHNEDLMLKSPFLRLGGNGDINIGSESIDYLAKVSVVATAGGQGGADLAALKGMTVPVRLTGPFDALKYRIDFGAMVGEAAKEKAKEALGQAISDRLGGGASKAEGQKADPKDIARDALKGLFKR